MTEVRFVTAKNIVFVQCDNAMIGKQEHKNNRIIDCNSRNKVETMRSVYKITY